MNHHHQPSAPIRFTLPFLLLATLAAVTTAQLTRVYEHGPVPLDTSATFHFSINRTTSTAHLAIIVRTPTPPAAQTWLGIGISEPTSGSMLGSDIATVQFRPNKSASCELVDRHVPFVPFPLGESSGGAPAVWPEEDVCQRGWTLVSCTRATDADDDDRGLLTLEVVRPLAASDEQDRAIPPGQNNVIYAYGDSFGYHSGNRASARVALYNDDDDPNSSDSLLGGGEPDIPQDVDEEFVLTATGYAVPDKQVTTYACTGKKIPLKKGERKMIVAIEPILNSTKLEHVHHLTVFLCQGEQYANLVKETIECTTGDEIPGPLASEFSACTTFVFGYAKGVGRIVLPEEAGFLVDEEGSYVVMETHYDNPLLESDATDYSGVRLHMTSTMRDNEAGSLLVGDSLVILQGQSVKNQVEYRFTCPSECTSEFSEPVNLFASFLHMHRTGQEIVNNRFDSNGKFIETINKVNFWSDSFQNNAPVKTKLRPGDQLHVSCLYDTRKLPDTKFGVETKDEMCMDFVGYWPVQRRKDGSRLNVCAFGLDGDSGDSFTVCGDIGDGFSEKLILPVDNPKFVDPVGAPTDFGKEPDTCPTAKDDEEDEDDSAVDSPPSASDPEEEGTDANADTEATESDADADSDSDSEQTCFPALATVETRGGRRKRMDELRIGDEVLVGDGQFSPVFMFTHNDASAEYQFVHLHTVSAKLSLTRGHYLYVNKSLRRASEARVGDILIFGNGTQERITHISRGVGNGLYNPQTEHGDIVVDGVVASTYTEAVRPELAHAALAPLRGLMSLVRSVS